jgi:hypothetical protein
MENRGEPEFVNNGEPHVATSWDQLQPSINFDINIMPDIVQLDMSFFVNMLEVEYFGEEARHD